MLVILPQYLFFLKMEIFLRLDQYLLLRFKRLIAHLFCTEMLVLLPQYFFSFLYTEILFHLHQYFLREFFCSKMSFFCTPIFEKHVIFVRIRQSLRKKVSSFFFTNASGYT